MLTPIASPQNAVALQALSRVGVSIGFGGWLRAALPVAELGLLLVHGLLLLLLRPFDCPELPEIYVSEKHVLGLPHALLLGAVLATTLLWATLSLPPLFDTFGASSTRQALPTPAAHCMKVSHTGWARSLAVRRRRRHRRPVAHRPLVRLGLPHEGGLQRPLVASQREGV